MPLAQPPTATAAADSNVAREESLARHDGALAAETAITEHDAQRNNDININNSNHSDDDDVTVVSEKHTPSRRSLDMPRQKITTAAAGPDPRQRLHFSDDKLNEKRDDERPPPVPLMTNSAGQPIHPHSNGSGRSLGGGRRMRPSEEFDRRFDGPFGRPSVTMTRRRSSQATLAIPEAAVLASVPPTSPQSACDDTEHVAVPTFQSEPPPLNYSLRTRKMIIFLFWTVIVFDSTAMPIALYFGLWYGVGPGNPDDERLSANTVFSIVTAALGGASILEYFLRFWRLYKKDSTCRVRSTLSFFPVQGISSLTCYKHELGFVFIRTLTNGHVFASRYPA